MTTANSKAPTLLQIVRVNYANALFEIMQFDYCDKISLNDKCKSCFFILKNYTNIIHPTSPILKSQQQQTNKKNEKRANNFCVCFFFVNANYLKEKEKKPNLQ